MGYVEDLEVICRLVYLGVWTNTWKLGISVDLSTCGL
jgi:hypothetical protein